MFYPASSHLNAPLLQQKSETVAQPLATMSANFMPTLQQTIYGLAPLEKSSPSHRYEKNLPQTTISHPRLAPSSISSEEFLIARSGMSPGYNQNMSATREARTSNIHEEMPRFRDQIDILA